ncbi:MAG: hypothetical protein SCK29_11660 [Bacillota bacterium]|nr:hypothetical protein [Bacillota bacterium]MDW7684760.1 hypothetical protein [Bacillota bacterium]
MNISKKFNEDYSLNTKTLKNERGYALDSYTPVKKTMTIILILSLGISLLYNYKHSGMQQTEYQIFLNHYYFAVERSLTQIDTLLNRKLSEESLNRELLRLSLYLDRMVRLGSSSVFVEGVYPISEFNVFYLAADTLVFGEEHNGNKIPPFGQDNLLSEGEITYLLGIKEHLEYIHGQMYSEETRQENPNLKRESFKQIAAYISGTGLEHDFLLDKYLEKSMR